MGLHEFAASIESDILRHVHDCWLKVRTDRRVPSWSAIDALRDPIVCDYAWGWRYDAGADEFVCFLMGPKPLKMYDKNAVGHTIRQFYPGVRRIIVDGHLREIIGTPLLHRSHGMIYWREDRADMGERIMMPIRLASETEPDAVLGASVFDYTLLGAVARATQPVHETERTPLYD
jgi:hypothetical protein